MRLDVLCTENTSEEVHLESKELRRRQSCRHQLFDPKARTRVLSDWAFVSQFEGCHHFGGACFPTPKLCYAANRAHIRVAIVAFGFTLLLTDWFLRDNRLWFWTLRGVD